MAHMPQGKFLIENVPPESNSAQWLNTIIQKSILNADGFDWKQVKIERITNRNLERHYDVKRAEVGRFSGANLDERYGFTAELDSFRLDMILADGLQAGMINVNALGFAEYGVYVCDHLDVALRYSTLKSHDIDTAYVVVYKFILARNTKCVPKSAVSFERIDPTIGYDSHNSIIPPKPTDPITTQFERSQVYLYELNSQEIPMPRPRHCLPIAVLTYTRTGDPPPSGVSPIDGSAKAAKTDASPTDERFADNPALKAIVDRINAKQIAPIGPSLSHVTPVLGHLGRSFGRGVPLPARQPGQMAAYPQLSGNQSQLENDARFADNPKLKELIERINARTPWCQNGRFIPRQDVRRITHSPANHAHTGVGANHAHTGAAAGPPAPTTPGECYSPIDAWKLESGDGFPANGRYWANHEHDLGASFASDRRLPNQPRSARGRLQAAPLSQSAQFWARD